MVTWGSPAWGGDSSSVAELLSSVDTISSTKYAFAAKKADGSVITWGDSARGGDSDSVAASLLPVRTADSTSSSSTAEIGSTGTTWDDSRNSGHPASQVEPEVPDRHNGTEVWHSAKPSGDATFGGFIILFLLIAALLCTLFRLFVYRRWSRYRMAREGPARDVMIQLMSTAGE